MVLEDLQGTRRSLVDVDVAGGEDAGYGFTVVGVARVVEGGLDGAWVVAAVDVAEDVDITGAGPAVTSQDL